MCLHVITPSAGRPPALDAGLLTEFAVTSNGFVPEDVPLQVLPDPYYTAWERLIHSLPALLRTGNFRSQADELPVLLTEHLKEEAEWRRAYVILGFLTHGYIWGGAQPAEILPWSISIPFLQVCRRLELPPVAAYAGLNLWNFRSTSASSSPRQDLSNLDELRALHTFTGTEDESWFYVISVAIEVHGGAVAVPAALGALEALGRSDFARMSACLDDLSGCIVALGKLLDRMAEKCNPQVFYHQIRPFLAGTKNMAAAGLPRGVFYPFAVADSGASDGKGDQGGEEWWGSSEVDEEADKKHDSGWESEEEEKAAGAGHGEKSDQAGRWMQLRGGSNGQSSLFQLFDVVLGVEHTSTEEKGNRSSATCRQRQEEGHPRQQQQQQRPQHNNNNNNMSFHEEVRWYMPGPHRRFLEHLAAMGSLRNLAVELEQQNQQQQQQAEQSDGHDRLGAGPRAFVEAYKRTAKTLGEFRDKHLQVVTRYIVIPSRQAAARGEQDEREKTKVGTVVATNLATASSTATATAMAVAGTGTGAGTSRSTLRGTGGTAILPFLKQSRDETYQAGKLTP